VGVCRDDACKLTVHGVQPYELIFVVGYSSGNSR
jgi:hypothetical protein